MGKTSLIHKFTNREFKIDHLPTICIDYKSKIHSVGGKRIKFMIWDTAGQEKYFSITKNIFQNTNGVILCFSLVDRQSFEKVTTWMSRIRDKLDSKVCIILVGTKCDLLKKRAITREESDELAQQLEFSYVECSALSGVNVEEVFNELGRQMIDANEWDRESGLNLSSVGHKKCCF